MPSRRYIFSCIFKYLSLITLIQMKAAAKTLAPRGVRKMNKVVHRANSRGSANHGWLQSQHSFSFASYFNPSRMGFGLLRVLNDDVVAPGHGFGTHPHQNMEIVSIPLSGGLQHKDSEGNAQTISHGEVQIMSAGTGVFHSEYNASKEEPVNFLQIWVMPEKQDIKPRYDQKLFESKARKNKLQTVVSPIGTDDDGVKINQQAYFKLADLDKGAALTYELSSQDKGLYIMVLEGSVEVQGENLATKDAIGVDGVSNLPVKASENAKLLFIEVPMLS